MVARRRRGAEYGPALSGKIRHGFFGSGRGSCFRGNGFFHFLFRGGLFCRCVLCGGLRRLLRRGSRRLRLGIRRLGRGRGGGQGIFPGTAALSGRGSFRRLYLRRRRFRGLFRGVFRRFGRGRGLLSAFRGVHGGSHPALRVGHCLTGAGFHQHFHQDGLGSARGYFYFQLFGYFA